jgi:hypothetical protein
VQPLSSREWRSRELAVRELAASIGERRCMAPRTQGEAVQLAALGLERDVSSLSCFPQ